MSQLSRRMFLENSMWAATAALGAGGALGAGSLLNSRPIFGEEKSAGPNGILRVALIGAGGRGGGTYARVPANEYRMRNHDGL